ncbi:MAG TPA: ABC transporter permease [Terracidiphilus sp.]|nr:ABC transporter permease [Terracidiphilus sp.]
MAVLVQLRQVLRRLSRAPLFTGITLLTLAVGIGANTVVFGVVESVLLKPLSYPHPEQLIGVWTSAPGISIPNLSISPSLYFIFRDQSKTLEDIGAYTGDGLNITGVGQPEHVGGLDVTDGTLPLLGAKPLLGRLFTRRDDQPDSPKTVILSYGYWKRRFGGSSSVIGRPITVDGTAREIIGVLPRGFQFLDYSEADVVLPMRWDRSKTKLGNFSYQAIARLKPGATIKQANTDLARLIPIANHSFPAPEGFSVALFEKANITSNLHPLKKDVVGDIGNVLWVLMGSIAIVLLVACANVANLLLVRAEGRRQELAIRAALGADPRTLSLGLLLESFVLSATGALIGIGLTYAGLRVLVAAAPAGLPRLNEIGIDVNVLLFTLGLTLFVSFVTGLLPVLKFSSVSLNTGLREGSRSLSQSREHHRARKTLVVVQVALALVLLICSGLMIRTFRALANVTPGFGDPASLEAFRVYIPESQIPETQRENVLRMEQAIRDRLATMPGVTSVAISTKVPMDFNTSMDPVYAEDRTYKEGELAQLRRFKYISPGFFSTLGTPLIAGRDFTWDETYQRRPVAILSENTAHDLWGSAAAAIGKRVRVGSTDDWREVVGVAANIYDDGVSKDPPTSVYWPLFRSNFEGQKEDIMRGVAFLLRSPRAGSAAFMNQIGQAVWSINPDLPLANTTTVEALYKKSMERTSFMLVMLCIAGSMALLLGIVGIYGVISYAVTQRTREIGIRMALGARKEELIGMFVRQGLLLAAIGVAFGVGAAFATMRFIKAILFQVSPMDPWTYLLATAVVIAIAWIACYLPSRRAARVNPVNALRSE